MTGDRLAREALDIRPELPVIVCTGYGKRSRQIQEPGVRGTLIKPITRSELAGMVRRVLDQDPPRAMRESPDPMHNVLIIDDNKTLCRTLAKTVARLGMKASYETTLQDGLSRAARADFDVVFLDVKLPDGNGLDGIERLRRGSFPPEVIVITGHGSENGAETAIRSGAWDYIEKRSSFQNVRLALTRAIQYREQKRESPRRVALKRESIVGAGPRITDCLDQVAQAAGSDGPKEKTHLFLDMPLESMTMTNKMVIFKSFEYFNIHLILD